MVRKQPLAGASKNIQPLSTVSLYFQFANPTNSSSLPLLLPLPTGFLSFFFAYIWRQVSYYSWLGATLQATAEGTGSCCSGARQRRLNQGFGVWRPEVPYWNFLCFWLKDSFQSVAAVGLGFKSAIILSQRDAGGIGWLLSVVPPKKCDVVPRTWEPSPIAALVDQLQCRLRIASTRSAVTRM